MVTDTGKEGVNPQIPDPEKLFAGITIHSPYT